MTRAGLVVKLDTNGHFFGDIGFVERFIRTGVRRVNIALDGIDEDSVKAFRGPKADFDLVVKGIENLVETKKKLGAGKRPTMIQPNFFLVGAPKSGTTSLHYYLKQHPDIFMSNPKEPDHFCDELMDSNLFPHHYRDRKE